MRVHNLKLLFLLFLSVFIFSCERNEEITPEKPINERSSVNSPIEDEILTLINNHRRSKGLPALAKSYIVYLEAKQHSKNMADGVVPFGHSGFQQRIARIRAQKPGNAAGENVAAGQPTAQSVVNAWLGSSGHRANIENRAYNRTGIGVVQNSRGTKYYTQIFYQMY